MEYYNRILVIIKDEILPFATAWMDLEIIILNEIKSDREKQVSCDITYIGIQKKKVILVNLCTKQKLSHRKQT